MKIHIIKKGRLTFCGRVRALRDGQLGHFPYTYPAALKRKNAVYVGLCKKCAENSGMVKA